MKGTAMNPNEVLSRIKIASPCPARWESMQGNDRVRFCSQCQKNVYNLSAMSAEESADLIHATEGRLCARLYRREDGTLLTANCPIGVTRSWRKVKSVLAAAAMMVLGITGMVGASQFVPKIKKWMHANPPIKSTCAPLMGKIAPLTGEVTIHPLSPFLQATHPGETKP